ncbi:MAG TPA: diguanylate cyclase [Gammaproteobacteria bacterium]|nr:diguanylate cyclase [Gammaproteobacteria bacterium]
MHDQLDPNLFRFVVDQVDLGIVVFDNDLNVLYWNHFMETHSGFSSERVMQNNLFELFPELPHKWLERKVRGVFLLRNYAFTTWEHRPYLFRFKHHRPISGGAEYMHQNCTFIPVKNEAGDVEAVCLTIADVTDASIYQRELKQANFKLEEMSNRDPLTGAYNRRYMDQILGREFQRVKRYGGELALLMFDLDHFKQINDTYGHQAGDEVLIECTRRISASLRKTDCMSRYGGEEFAVILTNADRRVATSVAERIRQSIASKPIQYNGRQICISASIGLASYTPECLTHHTLIYQADKALYFSKENGRNLLTCYNADCEHA